MHLIITDWLRELRIGRIVSRITNAEDRGDTAALRTLWRQLSAEVSARSPRAVARLERERGLA